jgi:hypothetical protein
MNYSVQNQAQVSGAYDQAVKQIQTASAIAPVNPVGYANANSVRVDAANQLEQTRKTEQEFNKLAEQFQGATVGYTGDRTATSYGLVGSQIDVYA